MTFLVADIGATHARFALAGPGTRALAPETLDVAAFPSLEQAIAQFLTSQGTIGSNLQGAVLAAAGPVRADGTIQMTNCPWTLDPAAIGNAHGMPKLRLLNDMTAAALGLLRLADDDVEQFGGEKIVADAPKAILAPGTGLGVSGLIPSAQGEWTALASEGGHVDLAPHDARETAIVQHLLETFGHASPERVLSGRGLETLYSALSAIDASGEKPLAAAAIAGAARAGKPQALETTQLFCGWLGAVAGDLALTLGAYGGVYIAGGIVPKWGALFDRDRFRHRFAAKGRFDELLEPIPTLIVTRGDLALLGCVEAATQLLR